MQRTEAATPAVTEVSDDTFDAVVLSSPRPVLVEFSVSWCGHCHAMELAIEALAGEYAGRVAMVKVDTDLHPRVTARYGILGLPTFIVFRDGHERARFSGVFSKPELRRLLDTATEPTLPG